MDDITVLRDCLIADEIERIQSLTYQEAVRELIELRSKTIEEMGLIEVVMLRKKITDENYGPEKD